MKKYKKLINNIVTFNPYQQFVKKWDVKLVCGLSSSGRFFYFVDTQPLYFSLPDNKFSMKRTKIYNKECLLRCLKLLKDRDIKCTTRTWGFLVSNLKI